MTPYIKNDTKVGCVYTLPCGRCPDCLKRRTSAWSFRLLQELKHCTSAEFLTLTYDTLEMPFTSTGKPNLSKTDVQLFMKRLRKKHTNTLKYYVCGEYGTQTHRPHYHMILFNARQDLIQPAWDLGKIHYGTVEAASIGYTLKYMNKPTRIPMYKGDDRQKEFSLMSKGLGKSYLTPQMISYHKADLENRMHINILDGKKIAMPRYFKDKIYDENEREQIKQHMIIEQGKLIEEFNNHPEYLKNYNAKQASIMAAFTKQKFDSLKPSKI